MGQLSNTDKKSARSLLNCEFGLVFQMCQKLFLFGSKGILSHGNRIGFWADLSNWQCFPQKYFFQMFHYIVPRYKGSMKITRSHLTSHCFGHSNSFFFLKDALLGCWLISFRVQQCWVEETLVLQIPCEVRCLGTREKPTTQTHLLQKGGSSEHKGHITFRSFIQRAPVRSKVACLPPTLQSNKVGPKSPVFFVGPKITPRISGWNNPSYPFIFGHI